MKQPLLQGDAFLADVEAAGADPGALHIWWLGQSGFLVRYGDAFLLFDPYLSDSLTEKYAGTAKPHVRLTERVIAPERLDFVDVVTSSHNHTDHLDAQTLRPLLEVNSGLVVLVPAANRAFAAERLEVDPARLTPVTVGRPSIHPPFILHAVPAAHEELEQDDLGNYRQIGYVVEIGPWSIYHSGDTVLYPGMEGYLRRWAPDVALLPINGRDPARGVAGNLSGEEAVALAQAAGVGLVIPCHYDMFAFNTVSPAHFVEAAEAAGQPYRLLENGERLTLANNES